MANIKNHPYDAIIVPGVPYNAKKWSNVMRLRILWSKFLFEKGYTKNIIYSDGAVHSNYIESRIMGLYAVAMAYQKLIFLQRRKLSIVLKMYIIHITWLNHKALKI
ncbi:MAG: hypothetical protein IPH32_04310 [Bacteroidetes bacterium]|nr:hypothetical protein [Bacteroidota bacterium]